MVNSQNPVRTHDGTFWISHFWIPFLFLVTAFILFERTSLDIVIADFWYQLEGGSWTLRKNWWSYELMHHWGKRLIISIGLIQMILYAASWKVKSLRKWQWSLVFSITVMILLPALIATLKHQSYAPCPWDVNLFGGDFPYLHTFEYTAANKAGHCFPAGHSSGGFALLGLYFAFSPFVSKYRYLLLIPGLVIGISFGLAQQLRGAHFLSHDVWSAAICWFGALFLLKLTSGLVPSPSTSESADKTS